MELDRRWAAGLDPPEGRPASCELMALSTLKTASLSLCGHPRGTPVFLSMEHRELDGSWMDVMWMEQAAIPCRNGCMLIHHNVAPIDPISCR